MKVFSDFSNYDFSPHRIRINLDNLCRKGVILKIKQGRNVFFRFKTSPLYFSEENSTLLKEKKYKEKWNRLWWILIYDIPEKIRFKRNSLREFLKNLGFGKLQKSSWVSPYDFSSQIHNFCNKKKILKYVCLYEARFFSGKSIEVLTEEVWNLNNLNNEYQYLISRYNEEIEMLETKEIDAKKCLQNYANSYNNYKRIIKSDPFLPKDFLRRWPREKLTAKFNHLSKVTYKKINLNL